MPSVESDPTSLAVLLPFLVVIYHRQRITIPGSDGTRHLSLCATKYSTQEGLRQVSGPTSLAVYP